MPEQKPMAPPKPNFCMIGPAKVSMILSTSSPGPPDFPTLDSSPDSVSAGAHMVSPLVVHTSTANVVPPTRVRRGIILLCTLLEEDELEMDLAPDLCRWLLKFSKRAGLNML